MHRDRQIIGFEHVYVLFVRELINTPLCPYCLQIIQFQNILDTFPPLPFLNHDIRNSEDHPGHRWYRCSGRSRCERYVTSALHVVKIVTDKSQALSTSGNFAVQVLTRNSASPAAQELSALPNVTIVSSGDSDVYKDTVLRKAMTGVYGVFANTNGFAIGQAKEIYWGIRMYEIAAGCGVKHFIWASLFYASKLGKFDPKYAVGHADGKGKVAEYLSAQPTSPMKWSILSSCMYLETLSEMLAPRPDPESPETLVFSAPVGSGSPPLIYLPDLGRYALWMFDTPARSSGMNLQIATESVNWTNLAQTFTEVTGRKAIFRDVTLDEYFASGIFPDPEAKVGHSVGHGDTTLMTYRENFTGFWNAWKDDLLKVDYEILDEILPERVKSVAEWMRSTGYDGTRGSVLKDYADRKKTS
jgi:hypothetical protein